VVCASARRDAVRFAIVMPTMVPARKRNDWGAVGSMSCRFGMAFT
jgi:hypothetical protein